MSAQQVLFLAPNLLPGSGGVADYCLQLAAALANRGVNCHLASWNESAHEIANVNFPTLALHSPGATFAEKADKLGRYCDRFQINWISLQFVNFGYAERGLIGGMAEALRAAVGPRACHVFLHELWVGAHRGAKLRDKAWGYLQKRQILDLLRQLTPRAIWTTIDYYGKLLADEGVVAEVVPIFGNIPLSAERADACILQQRKDVPRADARGQHLLIGLFGTLHPSWPFQAVIPRLLAWAKGRRLVFVLFGQNGETRHFRSYIDSLAGAELLTLGPLPAVKVDQVMNSMDLALATTPAEGIGKSGSATAFLERGIPTVAVTGRLGTTAAATEHPGVLLLGPDLEERLDAAQARPRKQSPRLPEVTERYHALFATTNPTAALAMPS